MNLKEHGNQGEDQVPWSEPVKVVVSLDPQIFKAASLLLCLRPDNFDLAPATKENMRGEGSNLPSVTEELTLQLLLESILLKFKIFIEVEGRLFDGSRVST